MVVNQKSFVAERNGKTINSTVLLRKKGESEADFMQRMNQAGWKGLDNPENHFTADGMGYHFGSLSLCSKCKTSQNKSTVGVSSKTEDHASEYVQMLSKILESSPTYEDIVDHYRILYPDGKAVHKPTTLVEEVAPAATEKKEATDVGIPLSTISEVVSDPKSSKKAGKAKRVGRPKKVKENIKTDIKSVSDENV